MYWIAFRDSWKRLWKNPILILPDLLYYLFLVVVGYFILRNFGIIDFFQNYDIDQIQLLLYNFSNLFGLIVSIAIFAIGAFFIGVGALAWKYYMISNVIENRKLSFFKDFLDSGKKVRSIIFLKILIFAISIIVIFLGLSLVGIGRYFGNVTPSLVIVTILEMIFFLLFFVGIYFRYPILFIKELSAMEAFKESFKLAKKRYDVIIVTFFIAVVVSIALSSILNIFSFINIILLTQAISIIVNLISGVWGDLFLFQIFHKIKNKY
ncbi:hypothetical protein CL617_05210 [archaeon]|nr:hypothetical protein [archaeon]